VRLADLVLRRGHLSDQALAELCVTGGHPVHLDRCDLCAERAVELGRWLDEVRAAGLADADAAFPAERLTLQQAQIMRRLEQVDHPVRVIAFPSQTRYGHRDETRRIRPAWVGVAAAAGLVLGVIGGQMSARIGGQQAQAPTSPPAVVETPAQDASHAAPSNASLLDMDFDDLRVPSLAPLNDATPRATDIILVSNRSGG
jgi:hypothetical protein